MSLTSSRFLSASHLCVRVVLAGALLWVPMAGRAQERPTFQAAAPSNTAQADVAGENEFWRDQDVLSVSQRPLFERTTELLRAVPHPASAALFEQLRAQVVPDTGQSAGDLELFDPAKAVAFYGNFLSNIKDTTGDGVELRVRVSSLAAQLFLINLHNPHKALEVYDWSIALLQGTGNPMWMRLAVERDHLIRQKLGEETPTPQVQLSAPLALAEAAVPSAVTLGVAASPKATAIGATPDAVTLDAMKGVAASTPAGAVTTRPVTVDVGVAPNETRTASTAAPVNPFSAPLSSANPSSAPSLASVSVLPLSSQDTKRVPLAVPEGVVIAPMKSEQERAPLAFDSVAAPSALVSSRPSAVSPAGVEAVGVVPLPSVVSITKRADAPPVAASSGGEVATPRRIGNAAPLGVVSPVGKWQGQSKAALAVSFDSGTARRDAALARIKAGAQSPEDAWKSGALTYDNLCDFFQTGTGDWIVGERASDNGLHHALIVLLLAHESERFKNLSGVPQRVRLWLADYYVGMDDPRCVSILNSILDQIRRPVRGGDEITIQAIERLGWFYASQNDYKSCTSAWGKMLTMFDSSGWWTMDAYQAQAQAQYMLGNFDECINLAEKSRRMAQQTGNSSVQSMSEALLVFAPIWKDKFAFLPKFKWLMMDQEPFFDCGKPFEIYCLGDIASITCDRSVSITYVEQKRLPSDLFTKVIVTLDRKGEKPVPDVVTLQVNSKTTAKRQVIILKSRTT